MKIDSSFDSAFLQLQNGVNKAKKAASEVLTAVGAGKDKKVDVSSAAKTADGRGPGGIDVSA